MVGQTKQNSLDKSRRELYELVGRNVKKARQALNLTQEELALRVNMTRTSVTNIEKGRQKLLLHTLCDLALAMKVPVVQLMPDLQTDQPKITQIFTPGLSEVEREWIVGAVSNSSTIQ